MTSRESSRRILVADDEKLIADTLVQILNTRGFQAIATYSGEQALDIALEVRPDILIADVMMGGIDGVDTAISIKKIFPQCKILLCSGQLASESLLHKAELEGYSFEILLKPFHPKTLLGLLDLA